MSAEYDDLPFHDPDWPPAVVVEREPRKCKRHDWAPVVIPDAEKFLATVDRPDWDPSMGQAGYVCRRCGKPKDEARARRGRSSRNRGNAAERGIAKRWGGERRGQYGGAEDVIVAGLWVIQSKHGASYWPKRLVSALDALPRTEGRVPLLVVGDGSPGRHVRRLVILDERDWLDLHGEGGSR